MGDCEFTDLAVECCSFEALDRPTFGEIVEKFEMRFVPEMQIESRSGMYDEESDDDPESIFDPEMLQNMSNILGSLKLK